MDTEKLLMHCNSQRYKKIVKIVNDLSHLHNPHGFDGMDTMPRLDRRKIELFDMISAVVRGVTSDAHVQEINEVLFRNSDRVDT